MSRPCGADRQTIPSMMRPLFAASMINLLYSGVRTGFRNVSGMSDCESFTCDGFTQSVLRELQVDDFHKPGMYGSGRVRENECACFVARLLEVIAIIRADVDCVV